mmetsp:Transcript_39900/g.87088  ORF Transcript_39900/g.87088 Transcript_39900/m.87088 type:complete len:754 (+) Transcript_39900:22-2283(+)
MGKKRGAIAAKAKARREQAEKRAESPQQADPDATASVGPVLPADGKRVHQGLQNLGNTCFMNSVLQCLNASPPFSDALLRLAGEGLDGLSGSLCGVFRGIRGIEIQRGSKAGVSPKPFLNQLTSKFPWYRGGQQHDAHEFLRTVIGSISDEPTLAERKAKSSDSGRPVATNGAEPSGVCESCVWASFRGHLCAAVLCWGCGRISVRLDPFLDLSLDLPMPDRLGGPLGVNQSTASSSPPPPGDDDGEGEDSAGPEAKPRGKAASRKGTKGKQSPSQTSGRGPVPAPTSTAPRPPARRLQGAWGNTAAGAAEQARVLLEAVVERALVRVQLHEQVRAYLGKVALRAARSVAARATRSCKTVEIELVRDSKKGASTWGFMWNKQEMKEGVMVLNGIAEDSFVDKWNLKCRAKGDEELLIYIGDQLLEVNGVTACTDMAKTLRTENKISLKFARGRKGKALAKPDESDEETQKRREAKAERERRRQNFLETAEKCYEALPEGLKEVFGPGTSVARTPNGHYDLADCLRQFFHVEAIEDEFAPVYRCVSCESSGTKHTFASRRTWLASRNPPPLLTLQLKRFRRYQHRYEKSVASVRLPLVLDLSDFALTASRIEGIRPHTVPGSSEVLECGVLDCARANDKDGQGPSLANGSAGLQYELYGICVHQGSSMQGGHYVAYVNSGPSLEAEDWHCISDARLSSCTRAEVLKMEAYLAFYRRLGLGASENMAAQVEAAAAVVSAPARDSPTASGNDSGED